MKVTVNGESRDLDDGLTVLAMLERLGLKPEATVVQRNDDIVDRDRYGETPVSEGDTFELVRFVGGG